MNIFFLHKDPRICARYHCDKHVVKMILEYAQILSTAHRVLDGVRHGQIYKATHIDHPCSVWIRKSHKNYKWLYHLFAELLEEYTYRYGKRHATTRLKPYLWNFPLNIPITKKMTPRPKCVVEECKNRSVIRSYRNYYMNSKRHIANWKNREVPVWFI